MSQKKILFIVNPKSGPRRKEPFDLATLIRNRFPEAQIIIWARPDMANEIMDTVRVGEFDIVVAAGGDGTMNMVAQAVIGTNAALGILPRGSGNGLARQLNIPLDMHGALEVIHSGKEVWMDTGLIDGHVFLCTAGIGFDAVIGEAFAQSKTRGFYTYSRMVLREISRYRPEVYQISFDGKTIERRAYLLTIANAQQYGNNVFIAPQAKTDDGKLDICLIQPFNLIQAGWLAIALFRGRINRVPLYESYQVTDALIRRVKPGPIHYDGEPAMAGEDIQVMVRPASLRVIIPRG